MEDNNLPRICFSYLRFSRAEQSNGDSFKRQTDLRVAYLKRHNLILDTERMITDQGVSAYNGNNAATGALKGFLDLVRSGVVPAGSVFLVEALDRLSRDQIDPALDLIREILRANISVHTLSPERQFTKESLNDPMSLIMLLFEISAAHEYSVKLGRRVASAWSGKREKAKTDQTPLTKRAPEWLKVVDQIKVGERMVGGRYEVIPERAQVVETIYQLSADGLGFNLIARELARRGILSWNGKEWSEGYIAKLLRSDAPIGHHTPEYKDPVTRRRSKKEKILNLYPAIVSETLNAQAKVAMRSRKNCGGRIDYYNGKIHPFMSLLKSHSGAAIRITYRKVSRKEPANMVAFLTEADTKNGYPLPVFEALLLKELIKYEPAPRKNQSSEITAYEDKLARLDLRIQTLKDKINSGEDFDSFLELLSNAERERKQVSQRVEQLRAIEPVGQGLLTLQALVERLSSPDEPDHVPLDQDEKLQLRAVIRRMIKLVEVTIGRETKNWRGKSLHISITFKDGNQTEFTHTP